MTDDQDIFVPHYLTAGQCAARFAISLRHFKALVARDEMPRPVKFGGSSRWSVRTLEEFEAGKMLQSLLPVTRKWRSATMRTK